MPRIIKRKKDYAESKTDEMLSDLEKRIEKEYRTAYNEVSEKYLNFIEGSAVREKEKLRQLQEGKITEADFKKWKEGQVFIGKRWSDMADELAQDLTKVDKKALSMTNGFLPDAYALNHNYATYEVEKRFGINSSYTLYSRETVERLLRDDPNMLPKRKVDVPKDKRWNKQHINSAITQGVLQGDDLRSISKRLRSVTDMDKTAAIRNARTMMTGAQNSGRIDAMKRMKGIGVNVKKEWIATLDHHTRASHGRLDGEIVDIDKKFSNGCMYPGDPNGDPAEVYNCFIPSTSVAIDSDIIRSYKHYYSGEVISIESACGVKFTCTPNHPILTTRGWVKANLLNEGDNIIVTSVSNEILARRNPNINHVFSRFDAVHKALNKFGAKRTCALSVNFHGDIPTTEVEIITKKRFLRNHRNPRVFKAVDKFFLKSANKAALFFGTFLKHFWSIGKSSLGDVGGRCKAFPFFRRSVRHTNKHGFRSIANSDVVLSEYSINDLPTDVEFAGESLDRLAGNVFADKIVSVNVGVFNGHVYNLQTKNNYYFVNDIMPQSREKGNGIFAVAHNCRCTIGYNFPEYPDEDVPRYDNENQKRIKGMTYTQWAKTKLVDTVPAVHKIVDGKDISGTWQRRPEQFDFEIEDVINAQGFDGLPRVVDAEEFDRYVEESNFIAQRTYSAPDQETLDAYRDQLYRGKWYVDCSTGGAAYGQGMYCCYDYGKVVSQTTKNEMIRYGANREFAYTETFTLSKDAKTITISELNKVQQEYSKSIVDGLMERGGWSNENAIAWADERNHLVSDSGLFAASLGYDAVIVDNGLDNYALVLNRTKCIFKGE